MAIHKHDNQALLDGVSVAPIGAGGAYLSAGGITQPVITTGAGTITVPTMDCYLYSTSDNSGVLAKYTVPQLTNYAITDNTYYYVTVNYNSGSPIYSVITDNTLINHSNIIGVAQVIHEIPAGGTIDEYRIFYYGNYGLGLANKLAHNLIHTHRFGWQEGVALSENGTRYFATSAGVIWYDGKEISLPATDSNAIRNAHFYYHASGAWNAAYISSYNNTQYDNGTNLVTLTNNNCFAVNWVYRAVDSENECYVVLGTAEYTKLSDAQASQPPASLPAVISKQCVLVGRIIVQKNAATATQIDSAFAVVFNSSGLVNHNDLTGMQGGTTGEYYHLTAAEYSGVSRSTQIVSASTSLTAARVKFTGSTVGQTLTLPAGTSGADIWIRNAASVAVTVARSGSDTIELGTSFVLRPGESLTLSFMGTDWTAF